MEVVYNPPGPVAQEFHQSDAFIRGILGPVGSGKSSSCVMEIIKHTLKQVPFEGVRRARWAVIRNTYPELKSTTIKTWQAWVPEHLAPIKWDAPITCHVRFPLEDGTRVELEVLFLALDKESDTGKLRSLELTGVWLNEASEIPLEIQEMATQRVGRYPALRHGGPVDPCVIMDTNPPDDDHWWYQLAEVRTEETERRKNELVDQLLKMGALRPGQKLMEFFRQPGAMTRVVNPDKTISYKPNPQAENILNLPHGFAYYLRQMAGKSDNWIKVFICAEYGTTQAGKPVYPEYNDDIHCAKETLKPIPGLPLRLGWDFGLTPTCVIAQVTPRGQLRIIDELIADSMGIRQFAVEVVKPHLLTRYPGYSIAQSDADPAGQIRVQTDERTCLQELEEAGIPTEPASTNDFIPRREAVAYYLTTMAGGAPAFQLSPSCTQLRRGFNGKYRFDRVRVGGERYKDRPAKDEYSHPHDATQYLCLGLRTGVTRNKRARAVQQTNAAGWT
jgi:hypothetical protein